MDLKITNARLPEKEGLWEIAIANSCITNIAPTIPSAAIKTLDANGKLVIPGLVDAHFHLDKAFLLEQSPAVTGTFQEAMGETLRLKQSFTVETIQKRARRAIEQAIAQGTTAMRSHVEVDNSVGLTGITALLPLKQHYAWGITLQLAVFAQEGITQHDGMVELLRQAMAMGGDVIGSAPYVDPDPHRNIQIVFDLANEFDCDVDFHLDFLDDDTPLLLPVVIEETLKRGWQGRVCLGHMTKLAGVSPHELQAIAPSLQAAGISILALPASDLYMMARRDSHNVRRGVAPVHTLAALGVNAGLATNNVQNLFTPFGDGDVLKICTLLAQVLHLGTTASHALCLAMATTRAAQAMGLNNHGLEVGKTADLIILDVETVTEAIATAHPGRTVVKNGNVIAQSKLNRVLF